jgi:Spy/CpxP family protein refolding chaperone
MMNRKWIIGSGGAVLIIALTVFPGYAEEGHGQAGRAGHDQEDQHDHGGHYLKHLLKHAKEIGLMPEQIGKIKAVQLDFKRSEARLEADMKIAQLELHALMEDEQADLAAIKAKVDQLKKAEGACLVESIKSKRNAMAMLTPEQKEKERAVHEQMKSGGGQHGGAMGSGGMMGGRGGMGGMMGGMMGSMGSGGHGQGSGDHGSGGSSGGQQHQH